MGKNRHRCVAAGILVVGMSVSVFAGSAIAAADTETTSPTTGTTSEKKLKAAAAQKDLPRAAKAGDGHEPTVDNSTKTESESSETDTDTDTVDKISGEVRDPSDTTEENTTEENATEAPDIEAAEAPERPQTKTREYGHATVTNEQPAAESVEPDGDGGAAAGADDPTAANTPEPEIAAEAVPSSAKSAETLPSKTVPSKSVPAKTATRTAAIDAIVPTAAEDSTRTDLAEVNAMASSAVSAESPARPTIVNLIGSLVFGLLNLVVRVFEGPPAVPAGSTVKVARAPLEIDCGDGYTVEADWYYPTEGEPEGLILFQHGFPARAGLYNGTAAELAERTNSIVVAPSISNNLFACDGCQLGGEQMHAAVARLFLGDRAALLASAEQALGITELPSEFVLVGHSGGAQLVAGAGGFYELYGGSDLAGVILLDGAEVGTTRIARDIARIPLEIPVYNIAAEPSSLNNFGSMSTVFDEVRPGVFSGVQLVGGTHSDTFQTVNPVTQFVVYLMTGFPQEGNVEAAQLLMSGWVDDMFAGNSDNGIYGTPGSLIDIPTSSGEAQAYVLPAPAYTLSFSDQISRWFTESLGLIDVDYCAAPVPDGPVQASSAAQCAAAAG